jgi:hypothetical protein
LAGKTRKAIVHRSSVIVVLVQLFNDKTQKVVMTTTEDLQEGWRKRSKNLLIDLQLH